ncbi:MAG: hypothetical protein U0Z26_10190 [Anaerolineales bacterium]
MCERQPHRFPYHNLLGFAPEDKEQGGKDNGNDRGRTDLGKTGDASHQPGSRTQECDRLPRK